MLLSDRGYVDERSQASICPPQRHMAYFAPCRSQAYCLMFFRRQRSIYYRMCTVQSSHIQYYRHTQTSKIISRGNDKALLATPADVGTVAPSLGGVMVGATSAAAGLDAAGLDNTVGVVISGESGAGTGSVVGGAS